MHHSFHRFAGFAERIAGTSKRLEKATLVAEFLSPLDDKNLSLGARYFAGQIFSLRDGRVVNIGGAALLKAIAAVSEKSVDELRALLVTYGDIGDVALGVLPERASKLSLQNLSDFFETLATTGGAKAKLEVLTEILQNADALEAKYLVKILAGDLRIGLQEGAVEDSLARMTNNAVADVQRANMMLGDLGQTAILARAEKLDSARMKLFHPLKFMLASPAADLAEVAAQMSGEFAVEDKFDGIRAQAHIALVGDHEVGADETLRGEIVDGVRVALFSRTLNEITPSFPDLVAPLAALGTGSTPALLLDGEIVPVDENGEILSFQVLQQRLNRKKLDADFLKKIPVAFVAYDILFCGQEILLEKPFHARRAELAKLRSEENESRFRVAQTTIFSDALLLDDEFAAARNRGNEGLMVKALGSIYKPGRRGKEWLKIKRALATLDVVVTAVEVGSGRRAKVLSDYTFAVRASDAGDEAGSTLLNIGKAYSGLTDKEIEELSEWFRAHTSQIFAHGKVRTVEPKIVLEVAFDNVQISPRHKSGFALRFPRIVRVRDDKSVEEIDTLETVRRLAKCL